MKQYFHAKNEDDSPSSNGRSSGSSSNNHSNDYYFDIEKAAKGNINGPMGPYSRKPWKKPKF